MRIEIDKRYREAMSEVLHYLHGIRDEDLIKIPTELLIFMNDNCSKNYICEFDYNLPLNQLNIMDESKGMIGILCLKYICTTEEEKKKVKELFKINETEYQNELLKKFDLDDIFKNRNKR